MKKFVVLLVVVALTCIASMAFAASEIAVSGEMGIRSRNFSDLDMNKTANDGTVDTQQRVRLDVNAKAGDVKGKISIWNDFDTWGRFEDMQANAQTVDTTYAGSGSNAGFLKLREAWISFNLPGIPVNVTGGHQLLTLANGWFFRSMHYGSDAWVIANQSGNNTIAFVDVKFSEGTTASASVAAGSADDVDAYVLLDVMKLSDTATVGVDLTNLKNRSEKATATGKQVDLQNIGVNFNGKLGPVALKAEVDYQMGKIKYSDGTADNKFKGNQIVAQGNIPMDPVTINFTVARGTGDEYGTTSTDVKSYQNALDIDPHYTFLYEYKIGSYACRTAAGAAQAHKGFCGTTAISAGASFAASKSLTIGADVWMLNSTAKVQDRKAGGTNTTNKLGQEVDVKINWKLADNLSWNWNLGYFKPGEGMSATGDPAKGAQGILSFTF